MVNYKAGFYKEVNYEKYRKGKNINRIYKT